MKAKIVEFENGLYAIRRFNIFKLRYDFLDLVDEYKISFSPKPNYEKYNQPVLIPTSFTRFNCTNDLEYIKDVYEEYLNGTLKRNKKQNANVDYGTIYNEVY